MADTDSGDGPFRTYGKAKRYIGQRANELDEEGGGEVSCDTIVFDAQGVPMPNPKVYGYDDEGSPYVSQEAPESIDDDGSYNEDSIIDVSIPE